MPKDEKELKLITENTKFQLKFNNLWLAGLFLVTTAFWFAIMYSQLQTVILNQKELAAEFKAWRVQAEDRLGKTQSRQNQVIGFMRNNFDFEIAN